LKCPGQSAIPNVGRECDLQESANEVNRRDVNIVKEAASMAPTRVGFIGAGDISNLHAEGVRECRDAELLGLWNRTRSRGEEKSRKFGCRLYDTPEDLVADPAIDAVYVLTHIDTHHRYARMALEAGKHVLVEKPTAQTIAEIEDLKATADRMRVQCVPVHNYIYEPGINRTRALIDTGQIGDIVSVYIMYNIFHPDEIRKRVPGVIHEIMTHHAYILLYLVGKPVSVSAMRTTISRDGPPREDLAMATMKMANHALCHFCASFAADDHAGDPWTCMVKIIGTKGATRFSYRDWVNNTPAEVHSQTYLAYPFSIKATGRHFIERCVRLGEPPLSGLEDAVLCEKIVECCAASAEQGRHLEMPV
jgi:predicted dehydrogenase